MNITDWEKILVGIHGLMVLQSYREKSQLKKNAYIEKGYKLFTECDPADDRVNNCKYTEDNPQGGINAKRIEEIGNIFLVIHSIKLLLICC